MGLTFGSVKLMQKFWVFLSAAAACSRSFLQRFLLQL